MQFQTLKITEENANERLDTLLTKALNVSRSSIKKMIDQGAVSVNKKVIHKPAMKLKIKDIVSFKQIEEKDQTLKAEDIYFETIFEDKDILVINKPAGITVHPDQTGHPTGTVVNAVLSHLTFTSKEGGASLRPGIVHRLDKDTSGVLLIAKNPSALAKFSKLFQDRKVKKTYIALVKGTPKTDTGRIDASIKRNSSRRKEMAINAQGRTAVTLFEVVKKFALPSPHGTATLLKVNILTGRTHQIRLHLASIGLPIIGDATYGDPHINTFFRTSYGLTRQFLHAKTLEIDGRTFTAEELEDLKKVTAHI
ncbi:MAG: RluA family pseudouridine synthase [Candidatus Gracilibacteria bacterium]|jgi:23S rRNA pseudouridine1911/1915/1917 synthase